MAAPVTDIDTLINASGCYSGQTLGLADQKAIAIYLLAAQLNAVGGTNYLGALDTTLIADTACWAIRSPATLTQVDLQIDNNNATAAGASIGDISAQLLAAGCIRNASLAQLDAALLFLKAALGVAKAFPQ